MHYPIFKDAGKQLRFIAFMAVATLLLLYITAALLNWWGYTDARDASRRQLATLDLLLAEETARTIDGVRIAVDGVAEDMVVALGETKPDATDPMSQAEIRRSLARIVALLPQISEIAVLPAEGEPVFSSRVAKAAIPEHLLDLGRDGDDSMVFSLPRLPDGSVDADNASLTVVRRIQLESGRDGGVVIGVVPVAYFEELYRSLDIGPGGAVALWWKDGTLLAREPQFAAIGQTLPMFTQDLPADGGIKSIEGYDTGNVLPGNRVMAIKLVRSYPLAVSTSYSMDVVLVPWWRTMLYSFAGCIFLTLLAGLLIAQVGRQLENAETIRRVAQQHQKAIGERERIAEQLRQSQKLEVVGQLTAGIAHDFNNLLTVVIGNLEIIGRRLAKLPEDKVAVRSVESAMSGARKAATLTHRLLAFARKQPLAPVTIDMPRMLEGVAELLRRTMGEGMTVIIDVDPAAWPVYVDASQLENALVNLAVNSRDAMPNGGEVRIAVRNRTVDSLVSNISPGLVGDFVALSVSDTGTGMPPEIAAHAFEPFFSTKEIGKGSGLGLSQIYGFAKQSGGDCTIESAVGAGTTVTIYLPKADGPAVIEDAQDMADVVRGGGETVLVVDDNPQVRDYAVRALRELGYLVRQAGNADEALSILSHGGIDGMLTDIGLPGMEGPELAEEARKRAPDLGIVFMTGYTDRFESLRARYGDRYVILEKPFPYGEISRAMSEAMGV